MGGEKRSKNGQKDKTYKGFFAARKSSKSEGGYVQRSSGKSLKYERKKLKAPNPRKRCLIEGEGVLRLRRPSLR